jgi:hypothetical protein
MSQGVILVASLSKAYYASAVRCAVSIKDYSPNTNITLFTHASFIKERDVQLFDKIITEIPIHIRAKLWALPKSPYDLTLYMDSDMEVFDAEFDSIFSKMKDDWDMAFTHIRPHVSKDVMVTKRDKLKYHGGFFLYRKNEKTQPILDSWWPEYVSQLHSSKWPFKDQYSERMRPWDQFTLWRLLKQNPDVKVGRFDNTKDYRWNYIHLYDQNGIDESGTQGLNPVIYHHTLPSINVQQGLILPSPGDPQRSE